VVVVVSSCASVPFQGPELHCAVATLCCMTLLVVNQIRSPVRAHRLTMEASTIPPRIFSLLTLHPLPPTSSTQLGFSGREVVWCNYYIQEVDVRHRGRGVAWWRGAQCKHLTLQTFWSELLISGCRQHTSALCILTPDWIETPLRVRETGHCATPFVSTSTYVCVRTSFW